MSTSNPNQNAVQRPNSSNKNGDNNDNSPPAATAATAPSNDLYSTFSYQQHGSPPPTQGGGGGSLLSPGMASILEHSRDEERMSKRTRIAYTLLGACLLVVYLNFLHKHHEIIPFQHAKSSHNKNEVGHASLLEENDGYSDSLFSFLRLEGSAKSKSSKKSSSKSLDSFLTAACDDGKYSKRTLKRAYELPFASMFADTKGEKKYEASDVILVDGNAYAVCDNSWAISKFGAALVPFEAGNKLIGQPHGREGQGEDSGYEAIFQDHGIFYVLRESVLHSKEDAKGSSVEAGTYHAIIEELIMGDDDYQVQETCSCQFEFEGDSKGFEGVISLRDTKNELVVLGLCEGNHCSESRKADRGNGAFVAMKKTMTPSGYSDGSSSCEWSTLRKLHIPASAYFKDYSAATVDDNGRVAISSQEDSAIWIGQLLGRDDKTGLWDLDKLEFDPNQGTIYSFPKNDNCETIYCNIEGIHWINSEMLMAVSDKMKSGGKQPYQCFDKDQSVHVFVLP